MVQEHCTPFLPQLNNKTLPRIALLHPLLGKCISHTVGRSKLVTEDDINGSERSNFVNEELEFPRKRLPIRHPCNHIRGITLHHKITLEASWKASEGFQNSQNIRNNHMLRKHKQDLSPAIPKNTSYLLAIPTNPGLPLAAPSTLNLNTLGEGGDQRTTLLTLLGLHHMHASQLRRITLRLKLENSFLIKAHLAILRVILSINTGMEEKSPWKILSFLSLHMDHKIAIGSILQRVRSLQENALL